MMWWYTYGGPFGLMSGVMMIFWWLIIIMVIVASVRWMRFENWQKGGHRHGSGSDALAILKERYAKGEIDGKEYERRKKVLEE